MTIQVYLCDDNRAVLTGYEELLSKIAKKYSFEINVRTFMSGEQIVFCYEEEKEDPDIIYLDIMMKGEDGLETAKKLRNMGCHSEIIFLTANPEYVFESFEVSPANYIVKTMVSEKKFEEIFLKTVSIAEKKEKIIFSCENGSVKKNIAVSSIYYFEVTNRIITVYYDKQSFAFYATLEELVQRLDLPSFLRVHRSYLVHLPCIEEIGKSSLILTNGKEIPIGVTYAKKVKESMNHYFKLFH